MADRNVTYSAWLHAVAAHRRQVVAVRDEAGTLSYAELVDQMDAVAASLRHAGIEPGARVATAMRPSSTHLVVLLGAMASGAVAVPLNTRLRTPEALAYLAPIEPAVIIADQDHAELALATGRQRIVLDDALTPVPLNERLRGLLTTSAIAAPPPAEDDAALILPTGGTTGTPKGALWEHRGVVAWMQSVAASDPRRAGDVELFFSPFFHATLCVGVLAPLLQGCGVWIQSSFDPGAVIDALPRGVTHFQCAPTMLVALRDHDLFAGVDRTNVKGVLFGSTAATETFTRQVLQDFPNSRIRTAFGATELGGPVTGLEHDDIVAGRLASVGRPLPGATIRIVDDRGDDQPPGEVGELVVRSPWQSLGYYGRDDETAETFRADGIHIGDLGFLLDDFLHIAGRKKEMIITGGENVFPREVEEVVVRHPAVAEAIVYGVPDERWGERVEVGVRVRPGRSLDLDELRRFCAESLAGYKVPRRLVVIDVVPVTANNKPDRAAVRAAAQQVGEG